MANVLKMLIIEASIRCERQDCPAVRSQSVWESTGRRSPATSGCNIGPVLKRRLGRAWLGEPAPPPRGWSGCLTRIWWRSFQGPVVFVTTACGGFSRSWGQFYRRRFGGWSARRDTKRRSTSAPALRSSARTAAVAARYLKPDLLIIDARLPWSLCRKMESLCVDFRSLICCPNESQ